MVLRIGNFILGSLLVEFIHNILAEIFQVIFMIEPFNRVFLFLSVFQDKDKLRLPVGIRKFPLFRIDGHFVSLIVPNVPLTLFHFAVVEITTVEVGTDHSDIPSRTNTAVDLTQNVTGDAPDRDTDNTENPLNNAFPSGSDINAVVYITEDLSSHTRNVRSHRFKRSHSSGCDVQSG